MRQVLRLGWLVCASLALAAAGGAFAQYEPPPRVFVLPTFFVPKDQQPPTPDEQSRLMRHLQWAQARYLEMCLGRDTFGIASNEPYIKQGAQPLSYYEAAPEGGAPTYVAELLSGSGYTRFNCPFVFLVVLVNPKRDYPGGGGRPLNGGVNTGGGVVILSTYALDHGDCFQSTLQHELGHSFGLCHADVYGYPMDTGTSIMSYNPAHHTHGFAPSPTPGTLNPEDLRALALNHRVFPQLTYNTRTDPPAGYLLRPGPHTLGPMVIPGQSAYRFQVTTSSGEAYGSHVSNLALGRIRPDAGPGNTFDAGTMWHSELAATGWTEVTITFAADILLDGIAVHSEHSGLSHRAQAVRVLAGDGINYVDCGEYQLRSADCAVSFAAQKAKVWQLQFQAGESHCVVLRGLQFYHSGQEFFPPLLPPGAWSP